MSDLVRKDGWGEDVFSLIAARSFGDGAIAARAETAVRDRYRVELRARFETDPNVRESISGDRPASECREWVLDALKESCRLGTEDLFEQVVDELLLELDRFRKLPPSMYLVDGRTGQVVMPLGADTVVRPPDFVGEDGAVRKAGLIVHPGISSTLALKAQEEVRSAAALARADSAGPLGRLALEHERDPDSIRRVAKEFLESNGVMIGEVPPGSGSESSVEIGREAIDGVHQSPNHAFHRFRLFGESLGRKVLEAVGVCGVCELGEPVLQSNSKQRWYRVSFRHVRAS